ncbi:hypothetical protein SAMN05421823_107121 [Catalinimonas alkaloidigena]|uniref:Uncharacterized protein n=1 Tax=Catalinimonas alkaloidigena TaxID=1075417 RepID=A0A1G9LQM0_9BACT|nr:hypothetical protein [Catalinimonas alkaloidigena]SDL63775.1 hypothetical protein SAMN05421823_107121 [Catalinimonas alkaloidigena]
MKQQMALLAYAFIRHFKSMFRNHRKESVKAFIAHIMRLNKTQKSEEVAEWIADAEELVEYNEWGVALENLLVNLYEISFPFDEEACQSAKIALCKIGVDYSSWRFIEEMVR